MYVKRDQLGIVANKVPQDHLEALETALSKVEDDHVSTNPWLLYQLRNGVEGYVIGRNNQLTRAGLSNAKRYSSAWDITAIIESYYSRARS